MSYKLFDAIINDQLAEYESVAGSPYESGKFPVLETVPRELREIVKAIKVLRLTQRQFDILSEVRSFPMAGDAFLIPPDKQRLLEEFNEIALEIQKWTD